MSNPLAQAIAQTFLSIDEPQAADVFAPLDLSNAPQVRVRLAALLRDPNFPAEQDDEAPNHLRRAAWRRVALLAVALLREAGDPAAAAHGYPKTKEAILCEVVDSAVVPVSVLALEALAALPRDAMHTVHDVAKQARRRYDRLTDASVQEDLQYLHSSFPELVACMHATPHGTRTPLVRYGIAA